jgi:hypothetical protein
VQLVVTEFVMELPVVEVMHHHQKYRNLLQASVLEQLDSVYTSTEMSLRFSVILLPTHKSCDSFL